MSGLAVIEFRKAVIANCKGNAWIVLEYLHRKDRYYRSKGQKSFYHSRRAIAEATGLTLDQVRTALDKLMGAGLITKKTERGVCGSRVWEVVEFPTSSMGKNPHPVGEKSPPSRGKIPTHKAIEKSNSKSMQEGMPACPSKNQKTSNDPKPEQQEWLDALDSGRIQPHSRQALASLAIEQGASPEELKVLVGRASAAGVTNPGGYLRQLLVTDALERIRTGRMASYQAAAQQDLRQNAALCYELLQALGVDGMALGDGFDPVLGIWRLRQNDIDLKEGPYSIKKQLKSLYPGINPYDRGVLISAG